MRVIDRPGVRSAFLVLTLVLLLAGDAVRFTFGWWSFGVLAVAMAGASVWLLVAHRDRWRLGALPYPLIAFLALATLSILWSFYPGATALGLFTTWLIALSALAVAVTFSWAEILRGLGWVLRGVLGLSLLFELFVSLVLRAPILPLFTQPGVDYSIYDKIPPMLYWSRNELFEVLDEGRIQGILGNANNLGMLALLALIVFAIQFADRTTSRRVSGAWFVIAAITVVFTRSATVTVALVAVVAVVAVIVAWRRVTSARGRALIGGGVLAILAAGIIAVLTLGDTLLGLLGKDSTFTGRFGIWDKVAALAEQRPAQGWGWVSYWMPWAEPFTDLAFRRGVRQLQAHNAWIDLWFQLGVIGLLVFAALVVSTTIRATALAVDRPILGRGTAGPYRATTLLPLLLLVTLLVQSLAESRLLVEYGFFFLVLIAVKTRSSTSEPAP
jgi:exopolysaccharide production protein ExoQ